MTDNAFGPPKTFNAPSPVQTAAQVFANLDSAAVEMRYPFFQPDVTFGGIITTIRYMVGTQIGPAFFIEIDVKEASDGALGMHAVKLDGFSNIKAKAFAESDLKNLMLIALGKHNPKVAAAGAAPLTLDWAGDGQGPGYWSRLAMRMCCVTSANPDGQDLAAGTPVRGQTSLTAPSQANGRRKMKCIFTSIA